MKIETYKCDNCEALRKEVNHWWIVYRAKKGGLVVVPLGSFVGDSGLAGGIDMGSSAHLCGENGVAQYVSKSLASLKNRVGTASPPVTQSWREPVTLNEF